MIGISQIDHICIAVRDLPKAMEHWEPLLGKDKPELTPYSPMVISRGKAEYNYIRICKNETW